MKALIVGCGYLGRRVAARWTAAGHEVAAVTRSEAKAAELRAAGITPVAGDVTDRASLAGLPEADIVLYAVGYDRASGRERREVVVDGLRNALAAVAGKAGRLVFVSTTGVYRESGGGWVDEESEVAAEGEPGWLNVEAERVVREWVAGEQAATGAQGVPSPPAPLLGERGGERAGVVLRMSGLYGPGRLLRRVEQLRGGEPIAGSGEAWLNLVHVDDAAAAVVLAAERLTGAASSLALWGRVGVRADGSPARTLARPHPSPPPKGEGKWVETFLVSDDRPVRRREYHGRLAELTGSPGPVFDPMQESRAAGLGKRCRNGRAKMGLGLRLAFPTYGDGLTDSLSSGVRR